MRRIRPEEVTEAMLISSNVPLDDYDEWVAGEYVTGDEVRYGIEAYRAATTTTDRPDEGAEKEPPSWVRIGFVNRWKMLRDRARNKTVQNDSIHKVIKPTRLFKDVSLFGCLGLEAELVVTDPEEGEVYRQTRELNEYLVDNMFDFFHKPYNPIPDVVFEDLPPYKGAEFSIEVRGATPSDVVECGRLSFGWGIDLGIAVYGTSVSRVRVDGESIPLVDYRVIVPESQFDRVERELALADRDPGPWIGADRLTSTLAFGVVTDFRLNLSDVGTSDCTIEVEG